MTSIKQAEANRANAQLSTGPKTAEGKQVVSSNRINHGILSTKLLLAGESAEDYQALQDSLQAELRPAGTLELALVEKIAVILWRQRRLVSAETNTIQLDMTSKKIAREVSAGMGFSDYGDQSVKAKDLEPLNIDQEQITWCEGVIAEHEAAKKLQLDTLETEYPLTFKQLTTEADKESIYEYLQSSDQTLEEYAVELLAWCRKELTKEQTKAERHPTIQALAVQVKEKLSIPWGKLEVFSKYQTTLDNQLYKAMKALREAQEWRLKSLDSEPAESTEAA